jgi:microcystin-dependent protein
LLPFTAQGVFNPKITFVDNTDATAEDQNTQDSDIAAGLTQCMTRAGLAPATAALSIGGFQINDLGPGVKPTDAVNLSQISNSSPPGEIIIYAGTAVPPGFLLCDGSAVSRVNFAALFTAIGTTYGAGDSVSTFNVPDMRGRVGAGADAMGGTPANRLIGYNVGTTGGEQTHLLIASELPVTAYHDTGHDHAITDPGHVHAAFHDQFVITGGGAAGSLTVGAGLDAQSNTTNSTTGITAVGSTANITNTGGGNAHNNVQPTIAFNYLIRY